MLLSSSWNYGRDPDTSTAAAGFIASPLKTNGLETKRASLVAQMVKNLPAVRETWVRSLGQEDPLEKEMATHPSILAWKVPWMEEPGRL